MVVYIKANKASPTNSCIRQTTQPIELRTGPECERKLSGNSAITGPIDGYSDGYSDGYVRKVIFVGEDTSKSMTSTTSSTCNQDVSGYHRFTVTEVFGGATTDGACPTPYSRGVLGAGGFNSVIRQREDQLLQTTGKPVVLLRRQFTGPRCPCYSVNRGRSRAKCEICFGTSFVPGYIPFVNESDALGRIRVRFEPYTEDTPIKEIGTFQEITLSAWTLSWPIIRKRDVLIVYTEDGLEEYRYEVHNVTRNDILGGAQGAQKFQIKRIDPTQTIYLFDPFKVPDLADIAVDLSSVEVDLGPIQADLMYQNLGNEDDGQFPNFINESLYGDGAFSYLFTEGYKQGYEINFRRRLEFKEPLYSPDYNEDGILNEGYGRVFKDTSGKIIRFSTPQQIENNIGISPLEVLAAEEKRFYLDGFISGSKHGVQDAEIELRARGLL